MQTLNSTKTTEPRASQSEPFLIIDNVSKVYQTQKGPYTVLEGVNLTVNEGEFICLIGHSGCGKSTLLNMVAGFNQPTTGQVRLQGSPITEPGPERMVVFQNYSLLPWMSASENIHLGVETVYADKPREAQHQIVREHLELVGLTEAAHKRPGQLSGGMKQRVAIARALATRPQLLILDEPFGALDPITREELQEELLTIWREHKVTVLMITHDIDEALFLADRVVMMTNGPSAYIGEDLKVPFTRPRNRARIMEDPQYYELRNFALDFLFRRYAHSEVEEENTSQSSQTSSKSLPVASPSESNGKTESSNPISTEPDPKTAILATTSPTTIPFNASTATKESSMSSEPGSSTKSIALAVVWLATMIGLSVVNVTSVSSQKEATQTASASEPSPVLSSPSAPPPPPVSAVPQTTVVTTSPSPTSTAPLSTAASPASTSTTAADTTAVSPSPAGTLSTTTTAVSPSPASTPSTTTTAVSPSSASTSTAETTAASPSPASASPVAASTTTNSTVSSTEPTASDDVAKKLYEQIDLNWRTTPSFSENLVYRVKATQNGSIVQYEPTNNVAKDFVQETPLATLKSTSPAAPTSGGSQTTADFRVTFTPSGKVEVKPW